MQAYDDDREANKLVSYLKSKQQIKAKMYGL